MEKKQIVNKEQLLATIRSFLVAEIEDKDRFMDDLREELEKIRSDKGIPFDTAYLWITARSKKND